MLDRALSPRDKDIIRTVRALRQVTATQLGRLFFFEGTVKSRANRRTRALARLSQTSHITRVQDRNHQDVRAIGGWSSGSEGFTYTAPETRARAPNAHTLAIVELYVRLVEATRQGRCRIELEGFQVEPRYPASSVDLKPDAFVDVRTGSGRYHWFIEVDRGTEYRTYLERKLRTYLQALHDWPQQPFPRVLFTASDPKTQQLLDQLVADSQLPELFVVAPYNEAVEVLVQ